MVGILYSKKEAKNMSYSKDMTRVPVSREKARGASGEGIPVEQARGDGVRLALSREEQQVGLRCALEVAPGGLVNGLDAGEEREVSRVSAEMLASSLQIR